MRSLEEVQEYCNENGIFYATRDNFRSEQGYQEYLQSICDMMDEEGWESIDHEDGKASHNTKLFGWDGYSGKCRSNTEGRAWNHPQIAECCLLFCSQVQIQKCVIIQKGHGLLHPTKGDTQAVFCKSTYIVGGDTRVTPYIYPSTDYCVRGDVWDRKSITNGDFRSSVIRLS